MVLLTAEQIVQEILMFSLLDGEDEHSIALYAQCTVISSFSALFGVTGLLKSLQMRVTVPIEVAIA